MQIKTITHTSPFGEWTHSECAPPHLAQVVEKIWHFEGKLTLTRERSFPKAYSEIILHLGPRFSDVRANGERGDLFPEACFAGPTTGQSVIEAPDETCCVIGIELHAVGAYRLAAASPRETLNITVSLEDALGKNAEYLAAACYAAPTVSARLAIVCQFIEQRLARSHSAHAAIEWASRELRLRNGAVPIAELQTTAGLSKAQFVSLFREQTGFTPKHYARILRFRNTLALLQRGHALSDAALSAGYFDQAHMYRDFHDFAQMTPADFVLAVRFPNSLSLPEAG